MKKFLFVLLSLFAINVQLMADRPVEASQLPKAITEFIHKHFPKVEVSYAKQDSDIFERNYTIVLTNGDKLEFTRKGEWTDLDCEHNQVPISAIPEPIRKYVNERYKNHKVTELKKERRHYDVKLSNDLELVFSLDGRLLRYD